MKRASFINFRFNTHFSTKFSDNLFAYVQTKSDTFGVDFLCGLQKTKESE